MSYSPTLRRLAGAAALAASGVPLAANAADSTLSFSASFTASGGDARYGVGDTPDPTYHLVVQDLLPLFDPALGTLERVSFTLSGWRRFDGVCSSPATAEVSGSCTARIDGAFFVDALNAGVWPPEAAMTSINPVLPDFTSVFPAIGESLPLNLFATASQSGEITDAAILASFFTDSGLPDHGIRLRFSPQDSGYFGMGGGAGFTAMLWDADATLNLSYHYTASPVPEPAGWATLAAGWGLLAWRRRGARPA